MNRGCDGELWTWPAKIKVTNKNQKETHRIDGHSGTAGRVPGPSGSSGSTIS